MGREGWRGVPCSRRRLEGRPQEEVAIVDEVEMLDAQYSGIVPGRVFQWGSEDCISVQQKKAHM